MDILTPDYMDIFIRLIIATALGLALGLERIFAGKVAGMRTYAMVSMTSALFIVISILISGQFIGIEGFTFDPLRVAAQIIVGIGFLGAGLIIFNGKSVQNLTTASGLWTSAGIGMAAGFGLYFEATLATALAVFILGIVSIAERLLKQRLAEKEQKEQMDKKRRVK